MNPLFAQALGSIIRWLLTFAAGYFVEQGIWTQGDADRYVAGAVLAILALLWSLWQKYRSHIRFLTALDLPAGSSPEKVTEAVGRGMGAKLLVFVLAATVAAGAAGCATANPRHVATVSVVSSHTVLAAAQDLTRGWRCGEPAAPPTCIPVETYRTQVAPLFVEAFDKDQKVAELARATPGDLSIGSLLGSITAILEKIAALLPPTLRAQLLAQIGGPQ